MSKKVEKFALIPAYNEEEHIGEVVKGFRKGYKQDFTPTNVPLLHNIANRLWNDLFDVFMFDRKNSLWTMLGSAIKFLYLIAKWTVMSPFIFSLLIACNLTSKR